MTPDVFEADDAMDPDEVFEEDDGFDPEDAFDDLPETHLDDEAYDAFVASAFDDEGRVRGDPPVGRFILALVVAIAIAALLLFS